MSQVALRWILLAVTAVVVTVTVPILVLPQLDADDYRYLDLVQQLRAGSIGLLRACIIENRWDHLWWIESEQAVRFFRPTLILSYLTDDVVHGGSAHGMLVTNGLLYLLTCLLATVLFARVLQRTIPTAIASLLFAGMACHSETIWYIAGRNETLAAVAFLLTLLLHGAEGRARWLALPCYLLALASKELTLPLPLIALAYDRWVTHQSASFVACLRARLPLFASYLACAVTYLMVRGVVIEGAGGSDLVFPYFVAPSHPGFVQHVWQQVITYGQNLLFADITLPFLRPDQFAEETSRLAMAVVCVVPLAAVIALRRQPTAYFFALLAVSTWLPACVVYVSERYVFLPSFGICGLAGVAIASRRWVAIPIAVWCAHQTCWLFYKNMRTSQTPHDMIAVHALLEKVAPSLPKDKPIYVLNVPSDTFGAQFFANAVRVVLRQPTRTCHVLTILPDNWTQMEASSITRLAADELEVRGAPLLMTQSRWLFPWTSLAKGTRVVRTRVGCAVEVSDGEPTTCRAVRYRLPQALDDSVFLRFTLPPVTQPMARGALIAAGRLDIVRP